MDGTKKRSLKFSGVVVFFAFMYGFLSYEHTLAQPFFIEVEGGGEEAQLEIELQQEELLNINASQFLAVDSDLQEFLPEEVFLASGSLVSLAGGVALKPGFFLRALKGLSHVASLKGGQLMMVLAGIATVVWKMNGALEERGFEEESSSFLKPYASSSSKPPTQPSVPLTLEKESGEIPPEDYRILKGAEEKHRQAKKDRKMFMKDYTRNLQSYADENGVEVWEVSQEQRLEILKTIVSEHIKKLPVGAQKYYFSEKIVSKFMPVAAIYIDAGCIPDLGGVRIAVVEYGGMKRTLLGICDPNATSEGIEILTLIDGLRCLGGQKWNVGVYTNSQNICDDVNLKRVEEWAQNGWKKTNGKTIKNKELWLELHKKLKKHDVRFFHMKAHGSGEEGE